MDLLEGKRKRGRQVACVKHPGKFSYLSKTLNAKNGKVSAPATTCLQLYLPSHTTPPPPNRKAPPPTAPPPPPHSRFT